VPCLHLGHKATSKQITLKSLFSSDNSGLSNPTKLFIFFHNINQGIYHIHPVIWNYTRNQDTKVLNNAGGNIQLAIRPSKG